MPVLIVWTASASQIIRKVLHCKHALVTGHWLATGSLALGVKATIRTCLESVLAKFNYGLKPLDAPLRGYREFLRFYRSLAPYPKTVFDIGVGRGTPWLYEAFPESRLVLVEALAEFEPYIRDICSKYPAEAHFCCLGAVEGIAEFRVHPGDLTGSGIMPRVCVNGGPTEQAVEIRCIPVRTLDSLASGYPAPSVIKIDVEGAELEVLRGAVNTIQSTDLILLETSIADRFVGAPDLVEVGFWLNSHGFRLFDIVEIATIGPRRIPCYLDVAFVRIGSAASQAAAAAWAKRRS